MFIKKFFVFYQLVSYLVTATLPPHCNNQFQARTYEELKDFLERFLKVPQSCISSSHSNEIKSENACKFCQFNI